MKKFFDGLSIKIFQYIYKKQAQKHEKRMQNLKKTILSGSMAGQKIHTSSAATLAIKNNIENEKKANQQKIENIINDSIKKAKNNPSALFDYIKGAKTKVYVIKKADKILSLINENEGFILPKKGLAALYLNLVLEKKPSFKTQEMFVIRSYDINLYAYIYQFYNWYCYKMKLSGYEYETQKNFKNVFEICETDKIDTLSYEEVLNLKGAIRRDVEAIDFVLNYVKNKSIAKKNSDKIKQGQSIRV